MKRNKMTFFIWMALVTAVIGFGWLGATLKAGIFPEKQAIAGHQR